MPAVTGSQKTLLIQEPTKTTGASHYTSGLHWQAQGMCLMVLHMREGLCWHLFWNRSFPATFLTSRSTTFPNSLHLFFTHIPAITSVHQGNFSIPTKTMDGLCHILYTGQWALIQQYPFVLLTVTIQVITFLRMKSILGFQNIYAISQERVGICIYLKISP